MSRTSQDQFYCKACILANERADYNDTPLTRREVREIFSNTRNLNFDIEHDHNYLSGVEILESYITHGEDDIDGEPIPEGSWAMILRIINPDLKEGLIAGDYTGVSLETNFTNDVEVTDYENERLQYKDVITKEEMMPVTVSFTARPANMLPLELMTHQQYTAKNRGDAHMNEEPQDEVTFLRGFVEKLFTNDQAKEQGTSKSMEAVPQPQSNNFKYQELIDSLIESQKVLPTLTQTIAAINESQVKMTESFNNLSQKIDTVTLTNATESMETNTSEDSEEDESQTSEPSIEAATNTEEEQPEPPVTSEEEQEQQGEDEEGEEDDEVEDDEEERRRKQSTQKNMRRANTIRPLSIEKNQRQENEYKNYIINRTYENLVGRKQ